MHADMPLRILVTIAVTATCACGGEPCTPRNSTFNGIYRTTQLERFAPDCDGASTLGEISAEPLRLIARWGRGLYIRLCDNEGACLNVCQPPNSTTPLFTGSDESGWLDDSPLVKPALACEGQSRHVLLTEEPVLGSLTLTEQLGNVRPFVEVGATCTAPDDLVPAPGDCAQRSVYTLERVATIP